MMLRTPVLAVALPLLASLAAGEDLTIVSKVTGRGNTSTSTMYMSSAGVRTSNGTTESIVDFAGSRIFAVDNTKKEYSEMTFAEMTAAMQQASARTTEALSKIPPEQLKMLPPAIREQMAGAGGGGALPPVTVTRGNLPKKIAGYDCDHWLLSMGDSIKMEIWATKALQPPATAYFDAQAAFMAGNPMAKQFQKMFEEMKKIQGFNLAQRTTFTMLGQSMDTMQEATEVKKGAIPASTFQAPAGYKKVESPLKAMGAAGRH